MSWKSFPTAEELRKTLEGKKRTDATKAIRRLRSSLESAINGALSNDALQATVVVPEELDSTPLHLIKTEYEKLGYRVKLAQESGTISTNLVRMPKRFITLYW